MKIRKIEPLKTQRKLRVAAYARVSTDKFEQHESFETQRRYYENFICQNPQWELCGVYADEGFSGTQAQKRPEFMRMISDAKAGKLDLILVKSISRFSRNVADAHRYVHELKEYNVEVRFEREAISSFDPSADMVFSMLSAVAQEESRSISENVKWAYRRNAEKGVRRLGNNRVLGYDEKGGKLVPNADAWIVKMIFEQYADGAKISDIIRRLNASGAKRMRSNRPFTPSSIQTILKNELYAGDRLLQKEAHQNYLTKKPNHAQPYKTYYMSSSHEAIISRNVWERVQTRLVQIDAATKEGLHFTSPAQHFLYGKVFCAECGEPFTRRTITNRDGSRYKAWCCRDRQKGRRGYGCKCPVIKEAMLLQVISECLETSAFDEALFLSSVERVLVGANGIDVRKKVA